MNNLNEKINFYLPGMHSFWQYLDMTINLLQKYPFVFKEDVNIGAVYGNFPGALWDGGSRWRLGMASSADMNTLKEIYNSRDIPVRLTMTNKIIEEKHTYDTYCNRIMEVFHDDMNEVLVANDVLEEYIRKEYPKYKIVRSTCAAGVIPYDDSDKYHMTVLDRRKNKDWELLNGIKNKEKIEFVLNELCEENCPFIYDHYVDSNKKQMRFEHVNDNYCIEHHNHARNRDKDMFKFYYHKTNKSVSWITEKEMREIYVPLGFKNFKIVGRNYPDQYLLESIAEYMVKPEYTIDYRLLMRS